MTGEHRGTPTPWWVRLTCWLLGHLPEKLAPHRYRCTRCDRIAPSPVELP